MCKGKQNDGGKTNEEKDDKAQDNPQEQNASVSLREERRGSGELARQFPSEAIDDLKDEDDSDESSVYSSSDSSESSSDEDSDTEVDEPESEKDSQRSKDSPEPIRPTKVGHQDWQKLVVQCWLHPRRSLAGRIP